MFGFWASLRNSVLSRHFGEVDKHASNVRGNIKSSILSKHFGKVDEHVFNVKENMDIYSIGGNNILHLRNVSVKVIKKIDIEIQYMGVTVQMSLYPFSGF